ncbi:galectin-6-like isoform X1 [Limulus polyphemus]|uniref:Galectin n=2 Tax=Limulus polyphemus TaxID=6850 RepID=A0ABM1BL05_LIMPO|nr:galectin-6-like isoform X1 [Limulus polyphemus]
MSLVKKLIQKAEKEPGLHYRNPSVPYVCSIPGGLSVGSKIFIQGMVPSKNPDRFAINLLRGNDPEYSDIYLHFNPRFQEPFIVVRNARAGEWGKEETFGDSPFRPATPFLVVISAQSDGYEIEVDGSKFIDFNHRDGLPLTNVTHLSFTGDVIIHNIQIPVETLPKHLRCSIPGKTKIGDIFFIRGKIPSNGEGFAVNIQCGSGKADDIIFHLNPRFTEGLIVCNTLCDDTWADEQREAKMPFTAEKAFELFICVGKDGFHTWVNGKHLSKFDHRLEMKKACTLYIEGDVNVKDVWINSAPIHLPPDFGDDTPRDLQTSPFQRFVLPTGPVASRIPYGLVPGSVVVVSGFCDKDPSRFYINLQCDNSDEADIMLHYNPRWDDPEGEVVVQNSRDEGSWGEEVRTIEKFPFFRNSHFDIQIFCQDDKYRIAVNGVSQVDFPHRLGLSRVDHILVNGDVFIHRILVL